MLTMRFTRFRALIGVAVLSLALLTGVVGTTQPVAARTNLEWLCQAAGGDLYAMWIPEQRNGVLSLEWNSTCIFPDGGVAHCDPGGCYYVPPGETR